MHSDAVNSGEAAELADAIGQLHALNGAVLSAMFDVVRVYDEEAAFLPDGATTMATWLAYALGVTFTTATGYVRVARAMPDLPLISAAFREGRLCFEQVRALIPVATADNEAELLARASGLTANQIERMVRRMLAISTDEAARANDRRGLWFRWSPQDLTLRLAGRLPAAEGAVVVTAIERLACGGVRPDPGSAHLDKQPLSALCADALVELASASLADDADVDRACIVVHADVEALAPGEGGTASLESGLPLAPAALRPEVAKRINPVVHIPFWVPTPARC